MTTYVLSMKWDEKLEEVGYDKYKKGPQWRKVVRRCRECDGELDEDRLVPLCSINCLYSYAQENSRPIETVPITFT